MRYHLAFPNLEISTGDFMMGSNLLYEHTAICNLRVKIFTSRFIQSAKLGTKETGFPCP